MPKYATLKVAATPNLENRIKMGVYLTSVTKIRQAPPAIPIAKAEIKVALIPIFL